MDRPAKLTGQTGADSYTYLVPDQALTDRRDHFLLRSRDNAGISQGSGSLRRYGCFTHQRNSNLLVFLQKVFTQKSVAVNSWRVGAKLGSSSGLHLHLQNLVFAAQRVKLIGFCFRALALLLFARAGDLFDTIAVSLVLVYQFSNVNCLLVHTKIVTWLNL